MEIITYEEYLERRRIPEDQSDFFIAMNGWKPEAVFVIDEEYPWQEEWKEWLAENNVSWSKPTRTEVVFFESQADALMFRLAVI